jgi:O-antigen/teichoic acid export membrane protein
VGGFIARTWSLRPHAWSFHIHRRQASSEPTIRLNHMSALKNIFYFLAAAVLSKPLGFLLSLVIAKSLGPADFGVWVTLQLIVSYSPIIGLGTVETLLKLVPRYLGRRDMHRVHEIENSVIGSIALAAFIVIGAAFFLLLLFPSTLRGISSSLLAMMLIASATSFVTGYFYTRFAAYENFKAAGSMDFLRSSLALVFVGSMVWLWGLRGAVAGYVLHELGTCVLTTLINVRCHGKVRLTLRRDLFIQSVRVGFPITVLWWVLTLTGSVDRVVLGSLLGPLAVGHYGLALSIVNVLYLLPVVVGRVLYPQLNRHIGRADESGSTKQIVLIPTLALGTLLANMQLALLVTMPYLYNRLLPKYHPGLTAGQILMLGAFFGCVMRNGANYLIAVNQERVFIKYIVLTLLFNVISDVSLVKAGFGIAGVALGTSLAGLLLTTLVWRRVLIRLGFVRVWTTLLVIYLPITLVVGATVCLRLAYSTAFTTFDGSAVTRGLGLLVLVNGLLYCSSTYRAEFQSWRRVISTIKATLSERSQLLAVSSYLK